MPIFDYKCKNTKCVMWAHLQELLVKDGGEYVECSNCLEPMELLITTPSYFHLKGSWPGKDIKSNRGDKECRIYRKKIAPI